MFVLAGTVYRRATDSDAHGLAGAAVEVTDAAGHEFTALTNRVGNFMVQVEAGLSSPQQREKGRLRIPWKPVFPLNVAVSYQGLTQEMESQVWREGSCAGCHRTSSPGLDHVEKVWHEEVSP